MLGLIQKMFIGLLTGLVMDLIIQSAFCLIHPTLINLHPNEYSQEFHYYPFAVKLDQCVGSCNTLNDLSNNVK